MQPLVLVPLMAQAATAAIPEPAAFAVRPDAAAIEAAVPAETRARRVGGRSWLVCVPQTNGVLADCTARRTEPKDFGFDTAALQLAPKYRLTEKAASRLVRRRERVAIEVSFPTPALSAPAEPLDLPVRPRPEGKPNLADYYPSAVLEREIQGRAVVACKVDEVEHRPRGCVVAEESPTGMGFGGAAVLIAENVFKMKPTTEDGKPVAGGTLRIPVNFALSD